MPRSAAPDPYAPLLCDLASPLRPMLVVAGASATAPVAEPVATAAADTRPSVGYEPLRILMDSSSAPSAPGGVQALRAIS